METGGEMKQPIYQTRHGIGQGGALPGLPGFALTRHRPHTHTSRVAAGDNSSVQPRGTGVAVALTAFSPRLSGARVGLFLVGDKIVQSISPAVTGQPYLLPALKIFALGSVPPVRKKKQPRYSAVKNFTQSNSRPRDLPSTFPRRLGLPSAPFASAEEGRFYRNQKK